MEMHQVRYFLAVCETLNFTRAAQACDVSQPALTRAVHKPERELGGLLLRRESSLTHLTDFGRLVRPHLERMMAEAEAAKSTALRFLQMDNAQINLGVMCSVGPIRFMSFLADFRAGRPRPRYDSRQRTLAGAPPIRRDLIQRFIEGNKARDETKLTGDARMGAYWGIDTDPRRANPPNAVPCDPNLTHKLARVSTRLSDAGETVSKQIINWGYAICDRSLRTNYHGAMAAAPPELPYPDAPLTAS